MTKKSLLILLSCTLIVSLLTSGWLFYQNLQLQKQISQLQIQLSSSPAETPLPSADPTADWKTYIHDIYNYSFKYPLDWKVENLGEAGPKIVDLVALNPTIKDYGPHAITISFTSENYQEFVENVEIQASRIIVDGVEGIKTKETWGDGSIHTTILLPYGKIIGNTIIILAEMKYGEIFDQILSTFKFLDNDNNSGMASPKAAGKTDCPTKRPQVCTMECIQPPPYLCGSDGKSYCTVCQACSNPAVKWYILQSEPCSVTALPN